MKEYKVGDKVWYATFDQREERVPCPVCYGNKKVVVVLGNGEEVQVDCRYCEVGFEGSKGWVKEYTKLPRAEYRMIDKITIEEDMGTRQFEFQSDRYLLKPDQMFETEEEALKYAEVMAEKENQAKVDKPKFKDEKTYAWNAGYHMKAAKRNREEAEYHENKAKICKSKAKEKI
jgi:hypothetical protein